MSVNALRRDDRGSVLALVPAGFLVLMLLAALAVDSSVSYLGQQQLHDTLATAATDSVTASLDSGSFYNSGAVALDPRVVDRTVCADLAAQASVGLHDVQVSVAILGDAVVLQGRATVDAVFGRAVPGWGVRGVRSSAQATLVNGPGPTTEPAAPAFAPLACG